MWFGQHLVASYCADARIADRYAEEVGRRFGGLEITVDDLLTGDERPVPAEQLWEFTPH